ncbi:hypothetical protein Taro_020653, partial [Colocasia esculenta]|nr:hypothetical protein [Colocasia esculenta]
TILQNLSLFKSMAVSGVSGTVGGYSTAGRSEVDSVDIHVKGLGIIGTEYKLKDGKIDINQLNAFNRILHFIGVVPFGCEGRPSGIQGVVPFGCEGRPGGVSRVLFPSGVKEDQQS